MLRFFSYLLMSLFVFSSCGGVVFGQIPADIQADILHGENTNKNDTSSREGGLRGVGREINFTNLSDASVPYSAQLAQKIGTYVGILLSLIGMIALGYVIYGGYLWVTASGEAEQAKQARDIIVNSVIAIVIVGTSYALVAYVSSILTERLVNNP